MTDRRVTIVDVARHAQVSTTTASKVLRNAAGASAAARARVRQAMDRSLTTVDQAGRRIGGNAARLLLERSADRHGPTSHLRLCPTLVVRRSTAAPAARP